MANSTFTYDQDAILRTNAFTRLGYHFMGWDTNEAGESVVYKEGANVKNVLNTATTLALYAVWEANSYTVYFNSNYQGGPAVTQLRFTYNSSSNILADALTRTGYTFRGWATSSIAEVAEYSALQNVANLLSSGDDVTLFAVWSARTFNVSYNGNGSTGGSMATSTFTYDAVNNLSNNLYTRTGYTFLGWATSSKAEEAEYSNGQNIGNELFNDGNGATLYAVWEEGEGTPYKVEHYKETLTSGVFELAETDSLSGKTNESITATAKNYTGFTYQADYNDGVNITISSGTIAPDGSTVLKLYYTRNAYEITFNSN